MYTDTHAHLDLVGESSPAELVERARAADVGTMINVGIDRATSEQARDTAGHYDGVWASAGIHPNSADEADEATLSAIEELLADPVCVAVGETGLDYYRLGAEPEAQYAAFRAQIDLAKRHDKALIVHNRDATADTFAVLDDAGPPPRVVLHCFAGAEAAVDAAATRGWFVSFAGNVTFTNAPQMRRVAARVPLELMLTETDAPYLAPHPHRGTTNEPSRLPVTATMLARAAGIPLDELARRTSANAARAFALPG